MDATGEKRTAARDEMERAVGTANGMNRIAILIPCHRIVNRSGELGGSCGGLWRKQRLLELESGREGAPRSPGRGPPGAVPH